MLHLWEKYLGVFTGPGLQQILPFPFSITPCLFFLLSLLVVQQFFDRYVLAKDQRRDPRLHAHLRSRLSYVHQFDGYSRCLRAH